MFAKTHPVGATRLVRRLITILLAVELLDELVDGLRSAAWPAMRTALELDYHQIGLLLGVPAVLGNALEPLIGLAADRGHRRTLCLGGGLAFALALGIIALAQGFWSLLAGFVLFFPASGAFAGLAQLELMDLDASRRARAMILWTIVGCIGALAGPLLVLAAHGDWRVPALTLAALTLAVTLALAHTLARQPAAKPTTQEEDSSPRPDGSLARLRVVIRNRAVRRVLVLELAAEPMLEVLASLLALYVVDALGGSETAAGWSVVVFISAMLAGNLVALPWLDTHGTDSARIIQRSAVLVLIAHAALLAAPSLAVALIAVAILGVLVSTWYPLLHARLYDLAPDASGTVMALHSATQSAFGIVPIVIGLIAETCGIRWALALLAIGPLTLIALRLPNAPASE